MLQRVCNHTALLVLGVVLGAILTAGWHGAAGIPQARAVATHGSDNFAIATGLIDNQIEALYFLDFLTGDLRGTIVNRRNAAFSSYFEYNILRDFQGIGDPPRFLMVTGQADIPQSARKIQIGLQMYGPGKVWFDDVTAVYTN